MNDRLNWKEKLDIVVEAGLQLVPTIGGSLATLYFGTKQEKRFKRIESFYQEISQFMNEQNIAPLPTEKHSQDALVHLIEELNDKVEKEHLEQKRQFFKKFFISSLMVPTTNNNFDERQFFLSCLSNMTLFEIYIIQQLIQNNNAVTVRDIKVHGVDQYAIVGAIGRIHSYGFLVLFTPSLSIGRHDNTLDELVQISEFGKKFVNFCIL